MLFPAPQKTVVCEGREGRDERRTVRQARLALRDVGLQDLTPFLVRQARLALRDVGLQDLTPFLDPVSLVSANSITSVTICST